MHTDACKALAAIWSLDWQKSDPRNKENVLMVLLYLSIAVGLAHSSDGLEKAG